jgi:antitoxin YefM
MSGQETLFILSDDEALADLRQSREDFATDDTFDAEQIRAELLRRRSTSMTGDSPGFGPEGGPP